MKLDIPARKNCSHIQLPPSKSWALRFLIKGAIKGEMVQGVGQGQDVLDLLRVFEELGLPMVREGDEVSFLCPFFEVKPKQFILETGEAGAVNRFLLPLLARRSERFVLRPHPRFLKRPQVYTPLRKLGAEIEVREGEIVLQGPLARKKMGVDCRETTQLLSGLMLAFLDDQLFFPIHRESSSRYVEMTQKVLQMDPPYLVPRDSSSLSYPLAMNALGAGIALLNEGPRDPYQADDLFFDFLLHWQQEREFDALIYPDLIPTLVFLASYTPGERYFKNLNILVGKESNRLQGLLSLLSTFDVVHRVEDSILMVRGRGPDHQVRALEMEFDHRMVMVGSLYLWFNGGGTITPAEAVAKSFPQFFRLFFSESGKI